MQIKIAIMVGWYGPFYFNLSAIQLNEIYFDIEIHTQVRSKNSTSPVYVGTRYCSVPHLAQLETCWPDHQQPGRAEQSKSVLIGPAASSHNITGYMPTVTVNKHKMEKMSDKEENSDTKTLVVDGDLKVGINAKEAINIHRRCLILWGLVFILAFGFMAYCFSFEKVPDDKQHVKEYAR